MSSRTLLLAVHAAESSWGMGWTGERSRPTLSAAWPRGGEQGSSRGAQQDEWTSQQGQPEIEQEKQQEQRTKKSQKGQKAETKTQGKQNTGYNKNKIEAKSRIERKRKGKKRKLHRR